MVNCLPYSLYFGAISPSHLRLCFASAGCITALGNQLKYIASQSSTILGFTVWSVSISFLFFVSLSNGR